MKNIFFISLLFFFGLVHSQTVPKYIKEPKSLNYPFPESHLMNEVLASNLSISLNPKYLSTNNSIFFANSSKEDWFTEHHRSDGNDSLNGKNIIDIRWYPVSVLLGEARFSFEKYLSKQVSFELGAGFIFGMLLGEIDGDLGPEGKWYVDHEFHGFALRGGFKLYTSNHLKTFFWEPLFLYKHAFSKEYSVYAPYDAITQNVNIYGVQLLMGFRIMSKKVIYEPFWGLGLQKSSDTYDFHDGTPVGTDFAEYFTLQLGFALGFSLR